MGAITISFIHDPNTGQRELWVDYESAADWLPAEHERRHRQVLKQLLSEGTIDPDQIDRVLVRVEGEEVTVEVLDDETDTKTPDAAAEKS